jgi:hypothetical protein
MARRKNPDSSVLLLVAAAAGIAIYFAMRPKAEAKPVIGVDTQPPGNPPGNPPIGDNPPVGSNPPAGCVSVVITTVSDSLTVRAEPNTTSRPVGTVARGATVAVDAQVTGEAVSGNTTWYHLADGRGYISGALSRCVTQPIGGNPPAGCVNVLITTVSDSLTVRAAPNTTSRPVGTVARGATVAVDAQVTGESVSGNTTWYHLADGRGYISGAFSRCV